MSIENTRFGANEIEKKLNGKNSIFFIGIGGVHMSALAHIAKERGFFVGGSDKNKNKLTKRLADSGVDIKYQHDEKNLDGYQAVVYTVALSPDNPEYCRAKREGVPCFSRADFLGYIMTYAKNRIGVAGMHGKSTCTSIVSNIFLSAGVNPTIVSGAELPEIGGAYKIGGSEHFIFEACEYMDSFLSFYPTVAVILNIEMDHVDYFKSMEQIHASFLAFMHKVGEAGVCVVNIDDENVQKCAADYSGRLLTFGVNDENADFLAKNIDFSSGCASFDVYLKGMFYCHIDLSVYGFHNIYNTLAAVACAWLAGIEAERISEGAKSFLGAKRRMEYKCNINGAQVYEDYAHHPTEISATIDGVRRMSKGRVWCVFQPHTFSRTAELFDEFAFSLGEADNVILTDIFSARESEDYGVSSKKLAEAIDSALYFSDFKSIAEYLKLNVKATDVVIVMGAGDIYKLSDMLCEG